MPALSVVTGFPTRPWAALAVTLALAGPAFACQPPWRPANYEQPPLDEEAVDAFARFTHVALLEVARLDVEKIPRGRKHTLTMKTLRVLKGDPSYALAPIVTPLSDDHMNCNYAGDPGRVGDRLLVFSQVSGQRSFWMPGGPAGQAPDVFDKMLARLAALDPQHPPVPPKGACLLRVDQKRYCRQNALAPLRDFLSECGFDRDFAAAKGNPRVTLSYAPRCPPGAVPFSRW